jgi:hypothetical protein
MGHGRAPRGVAFATSRLAASAQAVRDTIVQVREESAETPVGYPMVNEGHREWQGAGYAGTVWGRLMKPVAKGRSSKRLTQRCAHVQPAS